VGKVVHPLVDSISNSYRMENRDIFRMSGIKEATLESYNQAFGYGMPSPGTAD
jgi:hypothetical protein